MLITFSIVRFIVIPPRSKAVCNLTSVLFITYKTLTANSQKSCHTLHNVSYLIYEILLSFEWVQFGSHYITPDLAGTKK